MSRRITATGEDPHLHVTAPRVAVAAGVTILAALVELAASRSGISHFLVADAVHLLAHLGIFLVLLLPTRGAHDVREDVVTSAILFLVIAVAIGIGVDAAGDLVTNKPSPRPIVLLFSLFGLAANLTSAWLFRDPARKRWSFRAALAHELSDASLTVAGILAAGAIFWFRVHWIDPALGLAIAAWLAIWAARLIIRRIRFGRSAWQVDDGVDSV